jgi:hypothetical protein
MATLRFSLRHTTSRPFDLVYNSLLDFKKFGELHPCMKQVDMLEQKNGHRAYSVKEEVFLFGFFKIKPEYDAKVIEVDKSKCLQYTSQVKKNVYLDIRFTFSNKKDGGLEVNEEIELTCNRLVGLVFMKILERSHRQVFRNLDADER